MRHRYDPLIAARKERNRVIFQETIGICREGGYDTPSGRVTLPSVVRFAIIEDHNSRHANFGPFDKVFNRVSEYVE